METEEVSPKKPNFGLILVITAVALLCFFLLAYVGLRKEHAMPGRYTKHPVTELRLPGSVLLSPVFRDRSNLT